MSAPLGPEGLQTATLLTRTTEDVPASGSAPAADGAAEKPKVPERIYPLYSWCEISPNTRLLYIRDLETAEEEIARFKPGLVGFDLEWKPNWRKGQTENPVALVQLSNDDTILLIQVSAIRSFPLGLRELLWSTAYTKAGVGIHGDCKKLWNDWRVDVRNCVDLALLARTVDNARWKGKYSQPIGLARLCEAYEELTLNKGKITRSNWEALLSPQQQLYAANDSHSGLTLFKRLLPLVQTTSPTPLPTYYSFDLYQGLAYETSTEVLPQILWAPHNPNYDPGPLPEPKPPKEKKDKDKKDRQRGRGENAAAAADGNATSVRTPRNAESSGRGEGPRIPNRGRGWHPQGRGGQAPRGNNITSHQQYHPGQHAAPVASLGFLEVVPPNGDAAQNRPWGAGTNRGRGRGRNFVYEPSGGRIYRP